MASHLFHKGIVSRSLSTNQVGEGFGKELEVLQTACTLANDHLNAAGVDRRVIAQGGDWYMWKETTFQGQENSTWIEYGWRQIQAVHMSSGISKAPASGENEKILISSSWPMGYHASHMNQGDKDFYWINSFNLHNLEETLDESDLLPNANECTYNCVDLHDLDSGYLDNFFDSAKVNCQDFLTPSLATFDKILDSVKVGGVAVVYDLAEGGSLYSDCYSVHEHRMHRVNRRLLARTDYEVHHNCHDDTGVALAYRIG